MRLKSEKPDWRAMATLASSTVASWGSSTDAGSFLMGFLGARLLSLSESVATMVAAAKMWACWLACAVGCNW